MLIRPILLLGLFAGATKASPPRVPTPVTVTIGQVLSAFLADSGVVTRGLDWTHGDALAITWESRAPVAVTEAWLTSQGYTQKRSASAKVTMGSDSAREMTLTSFGTAAGIQHVLLSFGYNGNFDAFDPKTAVAATLKAEGMTLTLLKCNPATEGTMFGNLVYVLKAPGKTASALHLLWNCTGTGECGMEMALVYRRADLTTIDCAGG